MNKASHSLSAKLALFAATLIWGSSFLVVKNTMDVMQPHYLLAFRFTIGCLLLVAVFYKRLRKLNKEYFIQGGLLGLLLILAYSLQTIGITDTTPGKNAFLTAVYCVLVPFFFWAIDKKKPDIYNIIAAFVTIIGIGLVSLDGNFSIGLGDTFTLAGGVVFALHMVLVAKISQNKDPIVLTILQFAYAGIIAWIVAFLFEDMPTQWDTNTLGGIMYLAVFATAVALLLQNIGQKYTNPAPASIIMSLESVFGVVFSVIFYGEEITLKLLVGFCLIFIAIIISETKFSFIPKSNRVIALSEEI
jgi:drug/metabolite transporter (DMT)-like permease